VADSYFASRQSAIRLYVMGPRFIGVLKTATKGFPMHYLQRVKLPGGKGEHRALLSHDDASGCTLLGFVWVDRERRYFISTCSSTAPGHVIKRRCWRQEDPTATNNPPVLQEINIRQTEAGEVYYSGCSAIDEHNRHRQEHLNLEKKLQVMQWDKRANLSLLGMMCVDAYKLKIGCQGASKDGARAFFEDLATCLINNKYDQRALR
jgi:Transposase IS4